MTPQQQDPVIPPIRAALTELVADQSQPTSTREWYLWFQSMQTAVGGLSRDAAAAVVRESAVTIIGVPVTY